MKHIPDLHINNKPQILLPHLLFRTGLQLRPCPPVFKEALLLGDEWTSRGKAPRMYRMEVDGRFHILAILLQGRNGLWQGCTNIGHHIIWEIKFHTAVRNICGSLVRNSLHVTVMGPRIMW